MLVFTEFSIDENEDKFLQISCRGAGFIPFLLSLINLAPVADLTCTRKEIVFNKSGLKLYIPNTAVTAIGIGFKKSFTLLITALLLFCGGTGFVIVRYLSE